MIIYLIVGGVLCTLGIFLLMGVIEMAFDLYWEYKDRRNNK